MTITVEREKVISQIWQLVQELTPSEKLSLSERLTADVRNQLPATITQQPKRSKRSRLSNYAGVGAELWQTIDVAQYIEEERSAWQP